MSGSKVKYENLVEINPLTNNQEKAFSAWDEGENLILAGSAGTGKTFLALYLALEQILERGGSYDKVIIVISCGAFNKIIFLKRPVTPIHVFMVGL